MMIIIIVINILHSGSVITIFNMKAKRPWLDRTNQSVFYWNNKYFPFL